VTTVNGTLTLTNNLTVNGANRAIAFSPSGTGSVSIQPPTLTIAPTTSGTINNTSIGAATRSSGAFTTLAANGAVNFNPVNANIALAPTGTGTITINSGLVGAIDNINIGTNVPGTGRFTTIITTGAVTFAGITSTANVVLSPTTGTVTIAPVNVGAIDNINIGATIAGTGRFSTITTTGAATFSPANASITIAPTGTGTFVLNPATAGTADNINIGVTTRGSGAFTTLSANNTTTINPANNNVSITPSGIGVLTLSSGASGTLNNVAIGATTPSTANFTVLTATRMSGVVRTVARVYTATAPFTDTIALLANDLIQRVSVVVVTSTNIADTSTIQIGESTDATKFLDSADLSVVGSTVIDPDAVLTSGNITLAVNPVATGAAILEIRLYINYVNA
jgi:hypothetical protein